MAEARRACPCQSMGLFFEHMFENQNVLHRSQSVGHDLSSPADSAVIKRAQVSQVEPGEVLVDGSTPVEFTFRGRRFHVHSVLSRWCETGDWWNRISDGIYRPDDGVQALWRVEAAPVEASTVFEIERDDLTGTWRITVL